MKSTTSGASKEFRRRYRSSTGSIEGWIGAWNNDMHYPPTNIHGKNLKKWYREHSCTGMPANWMDRPAIEKENFTMTATEIEKKDDSLYFVNTLCNSLAHTEPVLTWNRYETIPCTPYHANEEKPMRALCSPTNTTAQLTGLSVTGSIEASKTDTQTQREYLLERHREIDASTRWGEINGKMTEAFAIHADNRPKTAKELFDGITSGKFTLKADESARQEIYAAKYGREDFYDLFDAVDWGGLKPDRAGFEAARDKAFDALKAAKDTIMIGSPSDGLTALQALEAWTPPAGPSN